MMIALLALFVVSAQLMDFKSVSIQRYKAEHEIFQSLSKKTNSLSQLGVKPVFAPSYHVAGVEVVDAFIGFTDSSALDAARALGVTVNSVFDDFATAQIPVGLLDQVSSLPGVCNVEVSKLLELCTDSTLSVTHAGQVIHGIEFGLPKGYDGTGVIVGMIDEGFDYHHLAFKSSDDYNRTRIVRVYDMEDSTAHPVVIGTNTLPGSVFMGEQIDGLITDANIPYGVASRATATHGTHTTSIAAGMHVNGYGGMAPNADIVMCVSRNMDQLISEVEVANCISYIYAYADSVNKPCVINLSVSTINGSHDGKDYLSKAIGRKTGPGRIIVVAAGNNGGRNSYSSGPTTYDKPFSMLLGCDNTGIDDDVDKSYYYNKTVTEVWVRGAGYRPVYAFHILDKVTKRIVWESEKKYSASQDPKVDWTEFSDYFEPDTTVSEDGYMFGFISQSQSGNYSVNCNVFNLKNKSYSVDANGKITSRYQIGVSFYPPKLIYPRQPDSCYINAWTCIGVSVSPPSVIYFDDINENGDTIVRGVQNYYARPSDGSSIGTYAVHDSVISVGAFIARNRFYSVARQEDMVFPATIGASCSFSSYQAEGMGPTGKALPTVCAPGYNVVAAGSRFYFQGSRLTYTSMITDDGSVWGVMQGTSMAAPTVAGIIAQWLQLKPDLTPGEIKDIIAHTAIKDGFTQSPRFGPNGKIDAMAGIQYILANMPVDVTLGDLNGDGLIDIVDLTMLISVVLGNDINALIPAACDLDQNGYLDIVDVTMLISMILGQDT